MVRNVEPAPPPGPSLQITLPQQLSVRTIPLLERQVDDALAQRVSDLEMLAAAVQIVDSAGLNWLLAAKARLEAANAAVKIIDPSPLMTDAFVATRLDSRFTIVHTNGSQRNA
jgi:anti-anti-sigma regulatory factor